MQCPRWIRLVVFALVLLLAAPSAAPQSTIANVCNTAWGWCLLPPGTVIQITRPCRCYTAAGQVVDGRAHSYDFSQVTPLLLFRRELARTPPPDPSGSGLPLSILGFPGRLSVVKPLRQDV